MGISATTFSRFSKVANPTKLPTFKSSAKNAIGLNVPLSKEKHHRRKSWRGMPTLLALYNDETHNNYLL